MNTMLLNILTLALSVFFVFPAHAITLSVNINDPFCNDASGTPFCSIGAALGAALPADTITVAHGIYFESVLISTDGLTVLGQGRPVIEGFFGVNISAAGVTFSGFEVRNTDIGIAMVNLCGNSEVSNNFIHDNRGAGLVIGFCGGNRIVANRVQDNGQFGILISESDANLISRNIVQRNGRNGFVLTLANDNNLIKNVAKRNGESGFLIAGASGVRFVRNVSERNRGVGFADFTVGSGTKGTANRYNKNKCSRNRKGGSSPRGLCRPQK